MDADAFSPEVPTGDGYTREIDYFADSILGQKQRAFHPGEQAERYYTGLQVTKDPGVPIVYAGFVGMIIGVIITFFMSHQSVCVALTERKGRTRVVVSGIADRNKLGMERKTEQLAERLKSA